MVSEELEDEHGVGGAHQVNDGYSTGNGLRLTKNPVWSTAVVVY